MMNLKNHLNIPVFFASTAIIILITVFGGLFPQMTETVFKGIQGWIVVNTSWFYVLCVGSILFFVVWLMFSRLGNIKLGPDHSTPDYSDLISRISFIKLLTFTLMKKRSLGLAVGPFCTGAGGCLGPRLLECLLPEFPEEELLESFSLVFCLFQRGLLFYG